MRDMLNQNDPFVDEITSEPCWKANAFDQLRRAYINAGFLPADAQRLTEEIMGAE